MCETQPRVAPSNITLLLKELENFGVSMYQSRKAILGRLSEDETVSDISDELVQEKQYHLEQLQTKLSTIQKQSSNLVQEMIAEVNKFNLKLNYITDELAQDLNQWEYWKEECPICIRRIRIGQAGSKTCLDAPSKIKTNEPSWKNFQTTPCCLKLFHSSCLASHYREKRPTTCPICRTEAINFHPLYSYGTNQTPDTYKKFFSAMTNEQFQREFQNLSNQQFRDAFDSWSKINRRNMPQQIATIIEQKIVQIKAQLQEE